MVNNPTLLNFTNDGRFTISESCSVSIDLEERPTLPILRSWMHGGHSRTLRKIGHASEPKETL